MTYDEWVGDGMEGVDWLMLICLNLKMGRKKNKRVRWEDVGGRLGSRDVMLCFLIKKDTEK